MDRHGLSPSRALGQNFLCDPGTIDKIVRLSGVKPGDRVVEIGPGLGSLTLGLTDAGASVLAIEIDRYLIPALEEVVAGRDVRILHADAMTVDWQAELASNSDAGPLELGEPEADDAEPDEQDGWSVVANLPYNVGTPLILEMLPSVPQLERYLVMVQAEVGERLAAEPGEKGCGIPSVITSFWGSAAVVGSVSSQVFFPQPKVESVLVRIERGRQPMVDANFDRLMALVRAGFGQRRKMIRRSLAAYLTSDQIDGVGIDPTKRAEALGLAEWGKLANV